MFIRILRHTFPYGGVVIAVVQIQLRFEAEDWLEPIQALLAKLLDILSDIGRMVFAAVNPFVEEDREQVFTPLILALVLGEPDIQTVVPAACGGMRAIGAMHDGKSLEIGNYGTGRDRCARSRVR